VSALSGQQAFAIRELVLLDARWTGGHEISIAIASLAQSDDTATDVLKRGDQALYRAKRDGRHRVVVDAA
jgi:PleD family two-component response regulator